MSRLRWRVTGVIGALVALLVVSWFSPPTPVLAERFQDPALSYSAPALAVADSGAALLVALGHDGREDRLCAWVETPGAGWSARVELASGPGLFTPRVAAVPGGGFVVCWSAPAEGDWEIYVSRRVGEEFSPPERVSMRAGADSAPALAVTAEGTTWIAWQGVEEGRTDLFAVSRAATDTSWSRRRVTNEATSDLAPSLAVDAADRPWVAWSTWRHGSYADGNYEVCVQRLDDDSAPQRVSDSPFADLAPTLVPWGGDLALVWTESYFPTRRNGDLVTVGYDRWADKVYRVARSTGGVFGASTELRLTENANKGITVSDRVTALAAPDGEQLWLLYGELGGELNTGFRARATVLATAETGEVEIAEPRTLGGELLGPAQEFGLAWRGEELLFAQAGHAGPNGAAPNMFLEVAPVAVRPDPAGEPLIPRAASARKPVVVGLMSRDPADEDREGHAARPTRVRDGVPLKAWFGNLHLHSDLSRDARGFEGSPDMNFQVVFDIAGLDFAGLSDHAEAMLTNDWWEVRKVSDLWNRPGVFVTLPGYEWTSLSYGHRNVYFPDTLEADANATLGALGPDGERTPDDLWAHLDERRALTIPHHLSHALSKPTDWSFESDRFQRLVEIFQVRGNYEYDGAPYQKRDTQVAFVEGHSVRAALDAGQRVGIIASPDHGGGMGLAGVWSEQLDRESIFGALYRRCTFGTTGAKMDLFLEVGGTPMGSVHTRSDGPVRVEATVHATVPGLELVLVRDGEELRSWTTEAAALEIDWLDEDAGVGARYYYLRAEQGDGHLGWTSPVWLDSAGG